MGNDDPRKEVPMTAVLLAAAPADVEVTGSVDVEVGASVLAGPRRKG
jgi:hypothetical protein